MTDLVGRQLGNYKLIRLLGKGGFADVYLGEHIHLGTMAAIKVLQARLASSEAEHFRSEARFIAHLKHPNIIPILDYGVDGDTPFLVMEYAPNGTLRQHHPDGVPLPAATVIPYVKQVSSALQYAHDRKLIHRDIKPENMLLGENNTVLLSDFGIATISQTSLYQSTQDIVGTVAYMAPEQIQGKPQLASDQYSLGVIVYEWLTGTRPFSGTTIEVTVQHLSVLPQPPRQKIAGIPADAEEVVLRALAKDPHQRFLSVRAFATAFGQSFDAPRRSVTPVLPPALKLSPSPGSIPSAQNQVPPMAPPPSGQLPSGQHMTPALQGPLTPGVSGQSYQGNSGAMPPWQRANPPQPAQSRQNTPLLPDRNPGPSQFSSSFNNMPTVRGQEPASSPSGPSFNSMATVHNPNIPQFDPAGQARNVTLPQSQDLRSIAPGTFPSYPQSPMRLPSRKVLAIIASALVVLLLGTVVLTVAAANLNKASSNASTPSSTATHGPASTPTLAPTATPGITPTPTTPQGIVLYQADWTGGMNGWIGSGQWKVLNGQLLSDGSGQSTILSPYVPQVADYAVEAQIQVLQVHSASCSNFGIIMRMTQDSQGGYKAQANCLSTNPPYSGSAQINTDSTLSQADFAPGTDTHVYRVEVQNNHIRFLVDGAVVTEAFSNRYLDAGRISLEDDSTEIQISHFAVLSIPVDATVQTPTPTVPPPMGNVIYKADWSAGLSGWVAGSGQWKVLNGQLLSDGSSASAILAPYVPTSPDYAVEARIQVIRVHSAGCSNFGLFARLTADGQGGYKAQANCLGTDSPYSGSVQINTNTTLAQVSYSPGSDWHTYRIEVKGNHVKFLVDGTVVGDVTDNNFLASGRIGLIDDSVEIVVSSFVVTTV